MHLLDYINSLLDSCTLHRIPDKKGPL